MAIIDLSAYFYSMLDTLKSFFFYHHAQCPHNIAKPVVDIESAQMKSVDIFAVPSKRLLEQEKEEEEQTSSFDDQEKHIYVEEKEESEEEDGDGDDEEEFEDDEEEVESKEAEGEIINFADVNMDSIADHGEGEKYRDEVIIMSFSTNSNNSEGSASSESSEEEDEEEYSDSEEEDSTSVSSLQLSHSPLPPSSAVGGLFGRVLSLLGGTAPKYHDIDHVALVKYNKNGKLNLV